MGHFSPRVYFQCRLSYRVHTAHCAIIRISVCVHIKVPGTGSHTIVWTHKTATHTGMGSAALVGTVAIHSYCDPHLTQGINQVLLIFSKLLWWNEGPACRDSGKWSWKLACTEYRQTQFLVMHCPLPQTCINLQLGKKLKKTLCWWLGLVEISSSHFSSSVSLTFWVTVMKEILPHTLSVSFFTLWLSKSCWSCSA